MAAVTNILGKENIPPGQKKPRRMKMILAEGEDDAVVRFATPQKKPLLAVASAPITPSIPLPIACAGDNADSDEDAIVVIKPRSPRSPSLAVAPAIAEEARRVLAETPAPEPILAPETPSVSISVPDAPVADEAAPSAEALVDAYAAVEAEQVEAPATSAPPAESGDNIASAELVMAAVEDATTSVDSTPHAVAPDEQKIFEESSVQTPDAPAEITEANHEIAETLAADAEAKSTDAINIEAEAEETEEEAPVAATAEEVKAAVAVPEENSEAAASSPVDASTTVGSSAPIDKSEETAVPVVEAEMEEPKCIEEQRAEELAARSVARVEAEAAAQVRGAQLEARLAELQKLSLPNSEAARATRSAVEERLAAVEDAWRRRIEAKTGANAAAADGATSGTGAPPPSPSIEERKQRIERLRSERMEMKQRLETSRATSGQQRREASKKKSLRWADDAGDRLTKARSYIVGSGERVVPGAAPPPLPETPAPTEIPARYLEI